ERVGVRVGPSNIRVDEALGFAAGMDDGALLGVADGLGVAPDGTRGVLGRPGLPASAPACQLSLAELDLDAALDRVDLDLVAVAHERDRPAHCRLRADMADAEAAGGAGEAAIGDERHLVAHALAVDGARGRQHLAHAGTAARPLIADDDD